MMLPMELRTNRDLDGQLQYAPFRPTIFADAGDELAAARGPGCLFREEWNALAGNAQRHKPFSLYRTERDVNPTPTATVQKFYNPQESSDLSTQLKRKGNSVAALKSSVPRFNTHQAPLRGPGSYFSDRYHGAFPALFDKMTPQVVHLEKLQAKHALAATFGIVPTPPSVIPASTTLSLPHRELSPRSRRCGSANALFAAREEIPANFPEIQVGTTRLTPALTPRNAYQNAANRQFILSISQAE